MCGDTSDEVRTDILVKRTINTLGLRLIDDCASDVTPLCFNLCHLQVDIANLFALLSVSGRAELHHSLQKLHALIIVFHLEVSARHDLVHLAVACIILAFKLLVHLKTLLQNRERIAEVTSFQVALAKLVQDVCVIISRLFHVLEEFTVNLERICKVLKCLLVSLESQVSFTKLSVCDNEQKDTLVMNCNKNFAQRKAVDASFEHFFLIFLSLGHHLKVV